MSELVIVGAGLIGCSFAAAARSAKLFANIFAIEPDSEAAARALDLGHVDQLVERISPGAAVLLAPPSHRVVDWLVQLADHDGPVVDVASVKGALLAQLNALGVTPPVGYVPCHPIAGRELSGADAALDDLFRNRLVVMTPTEGTNPDSQSLVASWWQALGATVEVMDADEHDRVYASTSHMPHLLAFAYLLGVAPEHLHHSGGGFRDFSRIGASDPAMWSAVFDLNAEAMLAMIDTFRGHLDEFAAAIESRDSARMHQLISQARAIRKQLDE